MLQQLVDGVDVGVDPLRVLNLGLDGQPMPSTSPGCFTSTCTFESKYGLRAGEMIPC